MRGNNMMQDIPDLLAGLRRTPKILSEYVNTIPENKLNLRRGDGFWTIAEHVSHLAEVQPMLLLRFQRFMHEEHPQFIPFSPSNDGDELVAPAVLSTTAALLQFEEYRTKQLLLLENADAGIWQRQATHPEYDQYSLYILTRHVLMHDYWHMYRVEELWLTKDSYLTKLE
jgi:DinB superfamily